LIAFQIHAGVPQTASYRPEKLVHNPKLEIAGKGVEELIAALEPVEKAKAP